ncbi:MAG: putative glycoside hydrolase [Patescibacteria group bacterium UBA2103]
MVRSASIFVGVALAGGALVLLPSQDFLYERVGDVGVEVKEEVKLPEVEHLKTPESVKMVYMSACAAGSNTFRKHFKELVSTTELNSVMIDVKDFSGTIAFQAQDERLDQDDAPGCFVSDMKELVAEFKEMGIYTIARITVFQDPYYAPRHPEQAVQKESDKSVWHDYKGLSFVDVGAREYWDYIVTLSEETYALGFDELNFDYIRYPSDGDMKDIYYPITNAQVEADPDYGKAHELKKFFAYLSSSLPEGAVTSADLFGMTTTNTDDLNIGQVMEYAYPYFDYIAPMTYPSHYPSGFYGIANPNDHVYDVMKISLDKAVERFESTSTIVPFDDSLAIASTTPQAYTKEVFDTDKIRPWIQDFDYGGTYGPDKVRAQIQAVYDAGLDSWMLWDPSNWYTKEALLSSDI